jgi:hypothetical protein
MKTPPRFSLLHATYRAGRAAIETRNRWIEAASHPSAIEHLFALDQDDEISMRATQGFQRVVNQPMPGVVTAVRNWNAAAAHARGDLLFVIADDLIAPPCWDKILMEIIGRLDPVRFAFAVKVREHDPARDRHPTLIRHPVVSRCFYTRHGLFDSEFRGVYCDNDFTMKAFSRAVVIDGSPLRLEHRHPGMDEGLRPTESQTRMNTSGEYEFGRKLFVRKWSRVQLATNPAEFFPAPPAASAPTVRALAWRSRQRALAGAKSIRRYAKTHLGRLQRPPPSEP